MSDISIIHKLSAQGKHNEATTAAARLLKNNPRTLAVLEAHASVHLNARKFSIALKSFKNLLNVNSSKSEYLFGTALCFEKTGELDKAIEIYLKLIRLDPENFIYRMNVGVLYRLRKKLDESLFQLRTAASLEPSQPEILHNLAITLQHQENFEEAIEVYGRVLKIDPNHYRAMCNMGAIYTTLKRLDEAREILETSLKIAPDYSKSLNNLGLVFVYQGHLDLAEQMFFKAIEAHPNEGKAYNSLISLAVDNKENVAQLTHIYNSLEEKILRKEPIQDLGSAMFSLGNFHEKQKNTGKAEKFYKQANDIVSIQRPYNNHKVEREFDRLKRISEALPDYNPKGNMGQGYIFIVGMPRSGTTLLESILASHPDIIAGDELPFLNNICSETLLASTHDPSFIEANTLQRIEQYYDENTKPYFEAGNLLIDKLPNNFFWIAVIRRIYPKAKILHIYRDPMDNIWSLFRANFENGHNYCYSLKSLGQFYAHYQSVMAYFSANLGGSFLSVNYDQLVLDVSSVSHQIFNYMNIQNFEFEETNRGKGYFSKTASLVQVQQPINARSVQGWRRHEQFLQPALYSLQKQQQRNNLPTYEI